MYDIFDEITDARDILMDGMGWDNTDSPESDVLDLLERVIRARRDNSGVNNLRLILSITDGPSLAEVKEWWSGW